MNNPDVIYMGSFVKNIKSFAILHKSGINVFTQQMSDKLIFRNLTPRKIVEGLCEISSTNSDSNSMRCRRSALLFELFSLSFQVLELTKDTRRFYDLTDAAMAIIRQDYYNPKLSAVQVAAQLGVTPNYLATLFKKADLLPLKKFIIQTRLEKAKTLLDKKRYSIKEVAYMTGWDNQFYFSNSFLGKYGVRPSNLLLEEV
jgi:AraC-like DNA-binding protein